MSAGKILVVDDDPQIRRVMKATLVGHGYEVITARTGEEALETLPREMPDLVLLDMNMPGIGGLETCRTISAGSDIPVIVLSVRNSEKDKVAALDAGADDYVTKPFGMNEVLARLRAALRRHQPAPEQATVDTPDFVIDLAAKSITLRSGEHKGEHAHLTPTEWAIVETLVRSPGRLITQRQLLQQVWGPQYEHETNYLRVHLAAIRKKLEPQPGRPRYFVTEPGIGYRFEPATD